MNYDPDFANDWLNKSREYNQILTKPRERELLLQRIANLEAGKKGQRFKDLEQELNTLQGDIANYQQTIKHWKGKSELLEQENKDKDQTINNLQTDLNKVNQEKTDLITQANNLLNQKDQEKDQIKQSFIQGKNYGTTHWIYWKNWAEAEVKKAQQKLANLEKAEVNFLKKVGFDTYPNLEKGVKEKRIIRNLSKIRCFKFFWGSFWTGSKSN